MNLKSFIKKTGLLLGLDIKRHRPESSHEYTISHLMEVLQVDLLLDVGANIGQYAMEKRKTGYKGKIISFEPLSNAYTELLKNSKDDKDWLIAPRTAIGDIHGEVEINISKNSVSSSILDMNKYHSEAAPNSEYFDSENVEIRRLDSFREELFEPASSIYLKIDTQGYEENVLNGSSSILDIVSAMQLEVSLIELYEGQLLFIDILIKMSQYGFKLYHVIPGFMNPDNGQLLQTDCIFIKGS